MGNKQSHNIPPLILKSWVQPNPNQDIFKNKLTSQYVRQHFLQITSHIKLDQLRMRMKQTNVYICRVAFMYHFDNDYYYVYTDQNRNKPLINNSQEWVLHKQKIIQAFIILARRYKPTNVCRQMIGVDFAGQIKVWIHPDPMMHKAWSPCSTQAEMISDILKICDQLYEQSMKNNKSKKQAIRNFDSTPQTPNQYLLKKRNNTQSFSSLTQRGNVDDLFCINQQQSEGKSNKNKQQKQSSSKAKDNILNFSKIRKPKDYTTPCTPQAVSFSQISSPNSNGVSWDTVNEKSFDEYFTNTNKQEKETPKKQEPQKNFGFNGIKIADKGFQSSSRVRKMSYNPMPKLFQKFNLPEKQQQNSKIIQSKNKLVSSATDEVSQKIRNLANQSAMHKKQKYLQCEPVKQYGKNKQSLEKSIQKSCLSKQRNFVSPSSKRIKLDTQKSEIIGLKQQMSKLLSFPEKTQTKSSQTTINSSSTDKTSDKKEDKQNTYNLANQYLFNEEERKQYIKIQGLIREKNSKYRAFKSEVSNLLQH